MSTCPGCGGIVGRDCYNPVECQQIARDMQMNEWERQSAEVALTPAEAAALARIREGWVVVPREPIVGVDFGSDTSATAVMRVHWENGAMKYTTIQSEEYFAAAPEADSHE